MVHLNLGKPNAGLLRIAGDLAERFKADVIGIVACEPMKFVYGDEYISGDIIDQERKGIADEIKAAEAEFRGALQSRVVGLEWRALELFSTLSDDIAHEARRADLVITSTMAGGIMDAPRRPNTSDLVMQVGRPVLIVPKAETRLDLEHVLLAWKDTRETRRAASDALPLLKNAARVTVVEIAPENALAAAKMHLDDVTRWLQRHGIAAKRIAALATGSDAIRLNAIIKEQDADLVVAGAYGHSRMREWALGGVTHDILLCANRCALVSH
jgi:nucleotide-binding universal stress UspA family protein